MWIIQPTKEISLCKSRSRNCDFPTSCRITRLRTDGQELLSYPSRSPPVVLQILNVSMVDAACFVRSLCVLVQVVGTDSQERNQGFHILQIQSDAVPIQSHFTQIGSHTANAKLVHLSWIRSTSSLDARKWTSWSRFAITTPPHGVQSILQVGYAPLWISDQPTRKDAPTRSFRHDFPQSPPYSGLHPVLPVADF